MAVAELGASKMVWPFLMGGAATICATSWLVGNGHAFKCSGLILVGFLGARIIMALPINSEYLDVIFAAMWVSIAVSIPVGRDELFWGSVAIKVLVFGAALCSLWGRLSHYYMHVGSLPYATADILVIAAMLLIGWSLRHDITDKLSQFSNGTHGLGGNSAIRSSGPVAYSKDGQASKTSEALPASKVRAHG